MNILVCCDDNYIGPLMTMLYSLFESNQEDFDIYLAQSRVSEENTRLLEAYIDRLTGGRSRFFNIQVDKAFEEVGTTFYYTAEMYYRLLAFKYLPQDLDRVLYLDPDILVINPLRDLYEIDFEGAYFAAAPHKMPGTQAPNMTRLALASDKKGIENYYNSGILMMDLEAIRQDPREEEIISYIQDTPRLGSLMPDQDLLNVVYRDVIKPISEFKYNYDSRRTNFYRLTEDFVDSRHIIEEVSIIHFCGRDKPWHDRYLGRFKPLYDYIDKRAKEAASELREVEKLRQE